MELRELVNVFPDSGQVTWIGVRPERRVAPQSRPEVTADPAHGLSGDHYRGGPAGKRQVTLIMAEHLDAVAALLGRDRIDPAMTRRNIVVRGINLTALHNRRFRLGNVLLEGTGFCHPCSRMEENLGPGGYNALRGHGGITARILEGGAIRVGDKVVPEIMP